MQEGRREEVGEGGAGAGAGGAGAAAAGGGAAALLATAQHLLSMQMLEMMRMKLRAGGKICVLTDNLEYGRRILEDAERLEAGDGCTLCGLDLRKISRGEGNSPLQPLPSFL
eukprot:749047-Hanusia_phi.AAC.6